MIKKLLIVFATAALISMACFTFLSILGFPAGFTGPPWADGDWRGNWRHNARNSGPDVSRNLPFTGSDRLDIAYPADITVTQGPQARFTITGPQDILDELRLDGGELSGPDGPRFGWGRRHHNGRLRIDIVSPNTHEFHLSGAEKLTLRNFDQDSLILHASGAVDVDGQGKAKRLEAHISGAGHLDLGQLPVDDAEVSISGAGDASLDAHASAEISISGVGHVALKSRPPIFHTHTSGLGSVDAPEIAPAPPAAPAAPAKPSAPGAKT